MHFCDYKAQDVIIRWYDKDHPTRPGAIDLLPWCERFKDTQVFQQGGPGGFYDYRRHVDRAQAEGWVPVRGLDALASTKRTTEVEHVDQNSFNHCIRTVFIWMRRPSGR